MKPQFSLNTLLFKWMTGSAVMCVVVVALVAAIGRAAATALIVALVAGAGAVCGGWYLEQRVLGCTAPVRRFLSLTLLGISAWLITLIQLSFWLEVPGAYGPVQYWTDAEGKVSFLFHVRGLCSLVVLACMIVAATVGVATIDAICVSSPVPKWRRCVLPILALAVFALAFQQFFSRAFFPTV